jgi:hypothetical protein
MSTFNQIFAHVCGYLAFLGPDKDPYEVATCTGPLGFISADKAKLVIPDKKVISCTRHWYKGH